MSENGIEVKRIRANATVAEAAKSIADIWCDMKSEIISALHPVKSPVINEAIKLAADECANCNENGSGEAGIEPGYLYRSCWVAANTTMKFVFEGQSPSPTKR